MIIETNCGSLIILILKHSFIEGARLTDILPEGLERVTPPMWHTFPPQHPMIADFFALIIFCLLCVNVTGNGLVMYIFMATKSLRTPVRALFCVFRAIPN